MSLSELELFGEEAENFRFPLIDVGGVKAAFAKVTSVRSFTSMATHCSR